MRDEPLDRSTALRKLLLLGAEEYRRRTALEALAEGRVSFGEAAEMAGVTLWEFWDLAKARKVHWVAGDVADDVKQALTRRRRRDRDGRPPSHRFRFGGADQPRQGAPSGEPPEPARGPHRPPGDPRGNGRGGTASGPSRCPGHRCRPGSRDPSARRGGGRGGARAASTAPPPPGGPRLGPGPGPPARRSRRAR